MWQKFSLHTRINLLLALVLALGLAANIARLVLEAGPRVQAEDQSVVRLAREFIDTIVAGLNEAPDADARLDRIVDDLNRLRHVSITRQGEAAGMSGLAQRLAKVELLQVALKAGIPAQILDQSLPTERAKSGTELSRSLWLRMLFSCVVDADFLDTEDFFDPEKARTRCG